MSEYYHASTSLNVQQNSSILEQVLAFAFDLVRGEAQSLINSSTSIRDPQQILARLRCEVVIPRSSPGNLRTSGIAKSQAAAAATQAAARVQAIQRDPLLRTGVTRLLPVEWRSAQRLSASAARRLQSGSVAGALADAHRASVLLHDVVGAVGDRLSAARHRVVSEAAGRTLEGLGYDVQAAGETFGTGRWTVLWGTRGSESMAVVVSPHADVTVDTMGLEGLRCRANLQEFNHKMAEHGVDLREKYRHFHAKRSGGALLQDAAQVARRASLPFAQAILSALKTSSASSSTRRAAGWLAMCQAQRGGVGG